jgi:Mn2+/Fe2+ NRAMP family transporter
MLAVIGPGLLTAATGVGAGDLATAGYAGARLGCAVLWAVVLGALLKYVLTEGLTRWQLATGRTLLEGATGELGRTASVIFLLYLLPWSFFVGAALISAAGVTAHALLPVVDDPARGRLLLGAGQSAIAVALVWSGGFRVFERLMAALVAVMFVAVVATAVLLRPAPGAIAAGLLWPSIPEFRAGGLTWTIALMGGVGGTLTVLCYGYWIREHGRRGPGALRTCRVDLAVGYAATALFGMAMLVIASRIEPPGTGTGLIVGLADALGDTLGPAGRLVFLVGAWAAVFSSLLGVWQAVPYLFADFVAMHRAPGGAAAPVRTTGPAYRGYLLALAVVPIVQVQQPFREVQKYYAVMGAAFIPLLAVVLLLLNGRRSRMAGLVNGPLATTLLAATLVLSAVAGVLEVMRRLGG